MEKRNQVYKPKSIKSMKITSINDYKDIHQEKDTVLVLGYFDALHRGHKVLLDKARQIADDKQLEVAVLTFNESPQLTFQRYTDDLLLHITAPQRRCDLLKPMEQTSFI